MNGKRTENERKVITKGERSATVTKMDMLLEPMAVVSIYSRMSHNRAFIQAMVENRTTL